jgi:hypothetical protein
VVGLYDLYALAWQLAGMLTSDAAATADAGLLQGLAYVQTTAFVFC